MPINPLLITAVASGLSPIIKEGSKLVGNVANSMATKAPAQSGNEFIAHLRPSNHGSSLEKYLSQNKIDSEYALKEHILQLKAQLASDLNDTLPENFPAHSDISITSINSKQLELKSTDNHTLLVGLDTSIGKLANKINYLEQLACSSRVSSNTFSQYMDSLPLSAKNSFTLS